MQSAISIIIYITGIPLAGTADRTGASLRVKQGRAALELRADRQVLVAAAPFTRTLPTDCVGMVARLSCLVGVALGVAWTADAAPQVPLRPTSLLGS